MAQKLYSESLSTFNQEINNPAVLTSISGLKTFLGKRKLNILSWSENIIAIPLPIEIELPPLGNFQDIDIRRIEPVLLVLDISNYPLIAPRVYPDRLDFPKDKLAHLYVAQKGKPPAFCLVRENVSEWYSNKQLKDFVIRVANWFRDAATGELTEDGNQFDPLRLEGYIGTIIYDYDLLASLVNEKKSFSPDQNFGIGLFERIDSGKGISFKLVKVITAETISSVYDDFKKENEKDKASPSRRNYHFGYIVWSTETRTFNDYCVDLPDDWNGFKDYCKKYDIDLSSLEKQIAENDLNVFIAIPVITAIKRPKHLIGFSGNIEFINFLLKVDSADVAEGKIANNISVNFQSHNQPLSRKKAKEISGFNADLGKYALIAGCGALGSKIVMHLARSGTTNYLLADPDEISPHNLVRHALYSGSEGMNKATGLQKEIKAMYPSEELSLLIAGKLSGEGWLTPELIKLYSWIFDFTASNAFFQKLIQVSTESHTKVCRAFISDGGNLGILFLEGPDRNPRIDDLQVLLYAQYSKIEAVSEWLKREHNDDTHGLSITVGIGCNSETTVLSDDIVSLHASVFSGVIKSYSTKDIQPGGVVYLNQIRYEPFFSNSPCVVEVHAMTVINAINDPTWQIRIKPGIVEAMKKEMGLAMPHETGGVFVGRSDFKTKTIHVVELIEAPPDSTSNPVCFYRGIEGLPEAIKEINDKSGNQLGYIGEWHTHPFGPDGMSTTDMNTTRRFKKDFERLPTPLPVFLMIITPTHILPYVF